MVKLGDIGEFGFIDRIAQLGIVRPEGVVKGIGDDCAVIALNGSEHLLVTTDLLVEEVHFRLDWTSSDVIGAKSLAVNLSDIAACGGTPREAFISLALPHYIELEWLDGFYLGLRKVAEAYGVNLLGGDTTRSKAHLVINVAVTGFAPATQVLYRHTAHPGDVIVITGPTGTSAAGCELLLRGMPVANPLLLSLVESHLKPRPHVREGRVLASSGACTAAIDVSDGLISDLFHVCTDSGVGALVREDALPVAEELMVAGKELGVDPLHWILDGGEDYVLLAAIRRDSVPDLMSLADQNHWDFFPIGEFVPEPGIRLIRSDGTRQDLVARGWDHFR
jgi:thiamine-monophosphate kinase